MEIPSLEEFDQFLIDDWGENENLTKKSINLKLKYPRFFKEYLYLNVHDSGLEKEIEFRKNWYLTNFNNLSKALNEV
jgi:hypothetical protein